MAYSADQYDYLPVVPTPDGWTPQYGTPALLVTVRSTGDVSYLVAFGKRLTREQAIQLNTWPTPTDSPEWWDEECGEIVDNRTLVAIEQGDYFPSQHPTYERLANGDIAITLDDGGWHPEYPERRITTIYKRHQA